MAVDGAEVAEAQRLEDVALRGDRPLDRLLQAAGDGLRHAAHVALLEAVEGVPHLVAHAVVGAGGGDVGQVVLQRPDRRVDRHVVVVEDDQQVGVLQASGVVEPLEGQAAGERSVADDGHGAGVGAALRVGDGHAERRGDRSGAVADAEGVVGRLLGPGERREPAQPAAGAEPVAAPGQHLVAVGLVADVPDDLVERGLVDVVQRDGELDHAEAAGEVALVARGVLDEELAQLGAELRQPFRLELPQVRGIVDCVEERAHPTPCGNSRGGRPRCRGPRPR